MINRGRPRLSSAEEAEIKKIEAETQLLEMQKSTLVQEQVRKNIGFLFRWTLIWLSATGLLKIGIAQEILKWASG